jgi:pilus assembly protein Flp/PilA
MERIIASFLDLLRDERGVTAIEYGLVATLISITIIVATGQIGQTILGFFQSAADGLTVP